MKTWEQIEKDFEKQHPHAGSGAYYLIEYLKKNFDSPSEKNKQPIGFRVKHIPTGLFYQPHKHNGSNLSKLGKVYATEGYAKSSMANHPDRGTTIFVSSTGTIYKATKDILDYKEAYGYNQVKVETKKEDWEIVQINQL